MKLVASFAALSITSAVALAQPALVAPYNDAYTLTDLGTPPNAVTPLGGICFLRNNPNILLIGGSANNNGGVIYSVPVVRDAAQHITGYGAQVTTHHAAPYIDGGLAYAPNGTTLLFTLYPANELGQINSAGVPTYGGLDNLLYHSVGTLAFVPPGYPGAGNMIMASYNGHTFYNVVMNPPDVNGFYTLNTVTDITITDTEGRAPFGPEGIVYVPRLSPLLPFPTMLVSEYSRGMVRAYDVGPQGQPLPATGRDFIHNLSGAEGGVLDPLTGDFLFSTFSSSNTVIVVRGFTVPPCNTADVGRQGGEAIPDHLLDNNDFVVFINYFFGANPIADVGAQGGVAVHDGLFDNNDFVMFINYFFSPCD